MVTSIVVPGSRQIVAPAMDQVPTPTQCVLNDREGRVATPSAIPIVGGRVDEIVAGARRHRVQQVPSAWERYVPHPRPPGSERR